MKELPHRILFDKNERVSPKVMVESEFGRESKGLLAAAQNSPTIAIKIIAGYSGE